MFIDQVACFRSLEFEELKEIRDVAEHIAPIDFDSAVDVGAREGVVFCYPMLYVSQCWTSLKKPS